MFDREEQELEYERNEQRLEVLQGDEKGLDTFRTLEVIILHDLQDVVRLKQVVDLINKIEEERNDNHHIARIALDRIVEPENILQLQANKGELDHNCYLNDLAEILPD